MPLEGYCTDCERCRPSKTVGSTLAWLDLQNDATTVKHESYELQPFGKTKTTVAHPSQSPRSPWFETSAGSPIALPLSPDVQVSEVERSLEHEGWSALNGIHLYAMRQSRLSPQHILWTIYSEGELGLLVDRLQSAHREALEQGFELCLTKPASATEEILQSIDAMVLSRCKYDATEGLQGQLFSRMEFMHAVSRLITAYANTYLSLHDPKHDSVSEQMDDPAPTNSKRFGRQPGAVEEAELTKMMGSDSPHSADTPHVETGHEHLHEEELWPMDIDDQDAWFQFPYEKCENKNRIAGLRSTMDSTTLGDIMHDAVFKSTNIAHLVEEQQGILPASPLSCTSVDLPIMLPGEDDILERWTYDKVLTKPDICSDLLETYESLPRYEDDPETITIAGAINSCDSGPKTSEHVNPAIGCHLSNEEEQRNAISDQMEHLPPLFEADITDIPQSTSSVPMLSKSRKERRQDMGLLLGEKPRLNAVRISPSLTVQRPISHRASILDMTEEASTDTLAVSNGTDSGGDDACYQPSSLLGSSSCCQKTFGAYLGEPGLQIHGYSLKGGASGSAFDRTTCVDDKTTAHANQSSYVSIYEDLDEHNDRLILALDGRDSAVAASAATAADRDVHLTIASQQAKIAEQEQHIAQLRATMALLRRQQYRDFSRAAKAEETATAALEATPATPATTTTTTTMR